MKEYNFWQTLAGGQCRAATLSARAAGSSGTGVSPVSCLPACKIFRNTQARRLCHYRHLAFGNGGVQ